MFWREEKFLEAFSFTISRSICRQQFHDLQTAPGPVLGTKCLLRLNKACQSKPANHYDTDKPKNRTFYWHRLGTSVKEKWKIKKSLRDWLLYTVYWGTFPWSMKDKENKSSLFSGSLDCSFVLRFCFAWKNLSQSSTVNYFQPNFFFYLLARFCQPSDYCRRGNAGQTNSICMIFQRIISFHISLADETWQYFQFENLSKHKNKHLKLTVISDNLEIR